MTRDEKLIEDREVRGLSFKALAYLLGCTFSIIVSVLIAYFGLKQKIDDVITQKNGDDRYYELKWKDLETEIQVNTVNIQQIESEINNNK